MSNSSVIQDFYLQNRTLIVGNQTTTLSPGTCKTTIELAFWPFQSPSNSLALILQTSATNPIAEVQQSNLNAANELGYTTLTSALIISFKVLTFALFDSGGAVKPVAVSYVESGGVVAFQFVFSWFDFVTYDPDFSVTLDGTGDGSSTDLTIGLSVGLGGGVMLIAFLLGMVAAIGAAVFQRRRRRRLVARLALQGGTVGKRQVAVQEVVQ
mgnify:CR=1 FL=1